MLCPSTNDCAGTLSSEFRLDTKGVVGRRKVARRHLGLPHLQRIRASQHLRGNIKSLHHLHLVSRNVNCATLHFVLYVEGGDAFRQDCRGQWPPRTRGKSDKTDMLHKCNTHMDSDDMRKIS